MGREVFSARTLCFNLDFVCVCSRMLLNFSRQWATHGLQHAWKWCGITCLASRGKCQSTTAARFVQLIQMSAGFSTCTELPSNGRSCATVLIMHPRALSAGYCAQAHTSLPRCKCARCMKISIFQNTFGMRMGDVFKWASE